MARGMRLGSFQGLCAFLLLIASFSVRAAASCNATISIESREQFALGEKVEFFNRLNGSTIAEYWVQDDYGNEVKSRRNTSNEEKKSFSPEEEGRYAIMNRVPGCTTASNKTIIVGANAREAKEPMTPECDCAKARAHRSGSAKAKDAAIYLLAAALAVLCAALIWKR
jgi:hypothetical protein